MPTSCFLPVKPCRNMSRDSVSDSVGGPDCLPKASHFIFRCLLNVPCASLKTKGWSRLWIVDEGGGRQNHGLTLLSCPLSR